MDGNWCISNFFNYFSYKKYIKRVNYIEVKPIFLVIISNLLIFFYIPAELSYLQPALILMYLVIVKEVK